MYDVLNHPGMLCDPDGDTGPAVRVPYHEGDTGSLRCSVAAPPKAAAEKQAVKSVRFHWGLFLAIVAFFCIAQGFVTHRSYAPLILLTGFVIAIIAGYAAPRLVVGDPDTEDWGE